MKRSDKIRNAWELAVLSFKMSPGNFFVVLAGSLLQTTKALIGIAIPALLVDMIEKRQAFSRILAAIGVYAGILLLANASEKAFSLLSTSLGYRANNRATLSVGQKAMRMKYAEWENEKTFDESVKAKTSTWVFSNMTDMLCENWLSSIFTLIPLLYIFSQLHPALLVLLLLLIAVEILLERKMDARQYALEDEKAGRNKKALYDEQVLTDLKYGKELRLYHALPDALEKFHRSKTDVQEIEMQQQRLDLAFKLGVGGLTFVKTVLVYLFAAHQFFEGTLALAQFLLFAGAVYQFSEAIKTFVETFTYVEELAAYYASYRRFMEIPEEPLSPLPEAESGRPLDIELRDVWFRYPYADEYALKRINLKIPYGSKVAIVGENGSGKTTLAKVLLQLYPATQGEVCMGGKTAASGFLNEWWKTFSPVFQDYILHPYSLRENLAFLDSPNEDALWSLLRQHGMYDRIKACPAGLDTFVTKELDEEGTDFSGGEKQKLAMVRAAYKAAPIFLLDEPTAAIDPLAELSYFNQLRDVAASKTALFITHRMASAKFADTILVMDKGEIVEQGSFDELLQADGLFAKMFGLQSSYYQ